MSKYEIMFLEIVAFRIILIILQIKKVCFDTVYSYNGAVAKNGNSVHQAAGTYGGINEAHVNSLQQLD